MIKLGDYLRDEFSYHIHKVIDVDEEGFTLFDCEWESKSWVNKDFILITFKLLDKKETEKNLLEKRFKENLYSCVDHEDETLYPYSEAVDEFVKLATEAQEKGIEIDLDKYNPIKQATY